MKLDLRPKIVTTALCGNALLPGEYVYAEEVSDDGDDAEYDHGYSLHPEGARLHGLEVRHVEVTAVERRGEDAGVDGGRNREHRRGRQGGEVSLASHVLRRRRRHDGEEESRVLRELQGRRNGRGV